MTGLKCQQFITVRTNRRHVWWYICSQLVDTRYTERHTSKSGKTGRTSTAVTPGLL